jgi:hypothetical protein
MKKIIAIVALVSFVGAQSTTVLAFNLKNAKLEITNGGEKDKEKAKAGKDDKACCKKEGKSCCTAPKAEGSDAKDSKAQPQEKEKGSEQPKK